MGGREPWLSVRDGGSSILRRTDLTPSQLSSLSERRGNLFSAVHGRRKLGIYEIREVSDNNSSTDFLSVREIIIPIII